MLNTQVHKPRSVLISGASVAGPTLAFWLDRYAFDVTVVERASAVRSGGYPIDIRGTAIEVIERMGLLPQVTAAHIASRALTFVDAEGKAIATIPIYDLTGNKAGRAAGVLAVRDSPELFAFLIFATETPPFGGHLDAAEHIQHTAAVFADGGWEAPRLVDGLRNADDLFFDTVSQIQMPCWSKRRVTLVGDAAFAPSFRSGQGTSLALVAAYVLAGELAAHDDPTDAFAAYERIARPFVEANQALAIKEDGNFLLSRTQEELDARNRMLAAFQPGQSGDDLNGKARAVHSALTLPDYSREMERGGPHKSSLLATAPSRRIKFTSGAPTHR
jgi:2-polyprenyl-6-methoxyphenol hydroxylase-like FAD-dependent oxidoreductase